jgi:hypothetical protein
MRYKLQAALRLALLIAFYWAAWDQASQANDERLLGFFVVWGAVTLVLVAWVAAAIDDLLDELES